MFAKIGHVVLSKRRVKRTGYTFRGGNSIKIVLPHSEKGFTLKGKNFFPVRVDPIQKQFGALKSKQEVTQLYPVTLISYHTFTEI